MDLLTRLETDEGTGKEGADGFSSAAVLAQLQSVRERHDWDLRRVSDDRLHAPGDRY